MKGADPRSLEAKINQHKVSGAFGGAGVTLGGTPAWDGVGLPPSINTREARLKALASSAPPIVGKSAVAQTEKSTTPETHVKPSSKVEVQPEPMDVDDDELAMAIAISLAESKPVVEAKEDKISSHASTAQSSNKQEEVDSRRTISSEEQERKDHDDALKELENEDNLILHQQIMKQQQSQSGIKDGDSKSDLPSRSEGKNDDWEEEMVPVPVDESILKELIDMGFSDTRARKGMCLLLLYGYQDLEIIFYYKAIDACSFTSSLCHPFIVLFH